MKHYSHVFEENTETAEFRTKIVMVLTGAMMIAEIIAGTIYNSMALLADGWHMSTHLAAFLIAVIAYEVSRKNRDNKRFTFGTGKVGVLGGFASSILLLVVACAMIYESANRLIHPASIKFGEALIVACIGLAVNVVCAFILKGNHSHEGHHHGHNHDDKNFKAAYLHVVADAFTSVTAIVALIVGLKFGIVWIDSLMGLLGSLVIIAWAIGIIKETVIILVDYTPRSSDLIDEINKAFSALDNTRISDLHVWQVGSGKFSAIISIEAKNPKKIEDYYSLVNMHEELVHVTIQISENA